MWVRSGLEGPQRGNNLLQYSCCKEIPWGQRGLAGHSPWVSESPGATVHTHTSHVKLFIQMTILSYNLDVGLYDMIFWYLWHDIQNYFQSPQLTSTYLMFENLQSIIIHLQTPNRSYYQDNYCLRNKLSHKLYNPAWLKTAYGRHILPTENKKRWPCILLKLHYGANLSAGMAF